MTNFEYYTQHVFPVAFRHLSLVFNEWKDLMTNNWENYELIPGRDPLKSCAEYFWSDLNDPDIYSKEFMEYLDRLMDEYDRGELKTIALEDL